MAKNYQPGNQIPTTDTNMINDINEKSVLWRRVYLISLLVVFVLMGLMSLSYGISGDEVDMNEQGKYTLAFFKSFGSDKTVLNMPKEYNRDGVMQYYGGFFDFVCAIVNKVSPLNEFTTRHILNAWVGFLAILFAAKLSVRAFGRKAGVLCIWLMFLSPFFLGNAMNNPKDIPFSAAYIIAIYCIDNLFANLPKPKISHYVWAIISIGLAIDVRVAGILLIPYMAIYAVLIAGVRNYLQDGNVAIKTWIMPLAIVGVLGYLAGSLLWPYALQNPLINPLTALEEMSTFKVSLLQLFEGEKVSSEELPSSYLIKSFFITNNYAILAGLVVMVFFLWRLRKHTQAHLIYFILFTGLFPLFYIIYKKSNVYHQWRHIMFIFPSLAIIASGAWYMLAESLKKRNFKFGMAIPALLLVEAALFIATTFPNTITYFNAFVGGVKGAYGNYEMDFYYNSLKQDADWFKKTELPKYKSTDTIIIATNASHIVSKYFRDNKNVIVQYVRFHERNNKKWDYSMFHIALISDNLIRNGNWLPVTTLFKAQSKGCTLSAVAKKPSFDDIKGFEALQRNQVDSGLAYLNAYIKTDPNNVEMLYTLANIYHQLKRDDLARQYMAQVDRLMAEPDLE